MIVWDLLLLEYSEFWLVLVLIGCLLYKNYTVKEGHKIFLGPCSYSGLTTGGGTVSKPLLR
jgi:hypothetical protein